MEAPESEGDVAYQINFYYGVHYPIHELEFVCAALEGTKFASLATDVRELTIGEKLFLRNVNSDDTETRGVIFPDDMSIQGDEYDSPASYCKFDPSTLTESEESNKECVEIITDIYDIIVAYYKKTGRGVKNLYLGWYVYNCEWIDGESDDEPEPSPKPTKKVAAKKNNDGTKKTVIKNAEGTKKTGSGVKKTANKNVEGTKKESGKAAAKK